MSTVHHPTPEKPLSPFSPFPSIRSVFHSLPSPFVMGNIFRSDAFALKIIRAHRGGRGRQMRVRTSSRDFNGIKSVWGQTSKCSVARTRTVGLTIEIHLSVITSLGLNERGCRAGWTNRFGDNPGFLEPSRSTLHCSWPPFVSSRRK